MAQYSLRFRRFLSLSSSLLHQQQQQFQHIRAVSPFISSFSSPSSSNQNPENPSFSFNSKLQFFRSFRSSALFYRNPRSIDDEEIGPDTILFKGCDYNHWLITMDLPKDYTPEQMVEAYVRAATQVFGSEEEAKKKIYACSTSVYIGFQVECSEETSEKFKEVEGVVFVLPDSYIDPVNNEYGGDKYVNGTIIPRPPPIQYGRREGRFNDRRPRVQNRGPMQGDNRNFGPPQNPPSHQNYGPVGGQPPHLSNGMPQNPATPGPQQNYSPAGGPPPRQNYGMPTNHPAQAPQQNYVPQRSPQGQYSAQLQNSPPGPSYGQQQNSSPGYNYGRQQNSSAGYNYGQPQNSSPGYNYSQPQNSSPGDNNGQSQNHPPQHGPSFTGHQNFGTSGAVNNGPTSASGGWNDYQSGRRDFQQQHQRGYPSADHGSNRGLGGSRQDTNAAYGQTYSNNAEEPRFSESGYGNSMHGGEQSYHDTADGVADQQHRY